jgi:hypothetical protein
LACLKKTGRGCVSISLISFMYLLLTAVAHGVAAPSCRSNSHLQVVYVSVLIPTAIGVVPGVIVLVSDEARNTFKQELGLQPDAPFSHSFRAFPSAKFEYPRK